MTKIPVRRGIPKLLSPERVERLSELLNTIDREINKHDQMCHWPGKYDLLARLQARYKGRKMPAYVPDHKGIWPFIEITGHYCCLRISEEGERPLIVILESADSVYLKGLLTEGLKAFNPIIIIR